MKDQCQTGISICRCVIPFVRIALSGFVLILSSFPNVSFPKEKPILAVMDIQDMSGRFDGLKIRNATSYMVAMLEADGTFRIVDRNRQAKQMVSQMKSESYKDCYDESCQVELGKALAADTILRSKVISLGGECTLAYTLIDLATEASAGGANDTFDCSEKGLRQSIERVTGKRLMGGNSVAENHNEGSDAQTSELTSDPTGSDPDKISCDKGYDGNACVLYGAKQNYGVLGKRDIVEAFKYFDKGCSYDAIEGCSFASDLLSEGNPKVKMDKVKHAYYRFKVNASEHPFGVPWGDEAAEAAARKFGKGQRLRNLADEACNKLHSNEACADLIYYLTTGFGGSVDVAAALSLATNLCTKGVRDGCYYAGVHHFLGRGVPVNKNKAQNYLEQSFKQGSVSHGGMLAIVLMEHRDNNVDLSRANRISKQGCEFGFGLDCVVLANTYLDGLGIKKDLDQAFKWYSRSCEYANSEGCEAAARMAYLGIGTKKDSEFARHVARRGCDMHAQGACGILGFLYAKGEGGPQQKEDGVKLLRKACEGQKTPMYGVCKDLGEVLCDSLEANEEDCSEARRLYRLACDNKVPLACANLSWMIWNSKGGPKDENLFFEYSDKACQGNVGWACRNLGVENFKVGSSLKDPVEGERLVKKACDLEDDFGCLFLGLLLTSSKRSAADQASGVSIFEDLCKKSYMNACTHLGNVMWDGKVKSASKTRACDLYRKACDAKETDACKNVTERCQ